MMLPGEPGKDRYCKRGVLGVGPGNSTTRDYLPQAYNDFIYAIIIEEYGLVGGAFIIFIYLVFLYRCIGFLNDVLMHSVHSWHWD